MRFLVIVFVLAFFVSCSSESAEPVVIDGWQEVIVEEAIVGDSYTYIRARAGAEEKWMAISRRPVETGKKYYHKPGLEMKNFTSKYLDREFATIFFVQDFAEQPGGQMPMPSTSGEMPEGMRPEISKEDVDIKPVEGAITLAELFADPQAYAGKTVKITAKVTKANFNSMRRNWYHVQDGTEHDGKVDLTITSSEQVNTEEVATFEGVIQLNRDFTAGYKYDIIMEGAKITSKVSV
jgi:hypothetical protein